ncbi:hypothetical protein COU56_02180 [Candidatus Pacearchaeota archaeon CG10_big_fil_rev_8_21_14_0_10_31_9]|nr:MAG: hypothetical protein AUJ62_01370 [Candidatus Pacearchaeota archaeon CG1_02_32_21]PIN95050.1 MAG: hypothetical protein COU56_02180 [Candidatus Pacearchaeota archaeon CG10_big_fil_rev_8_21_14_0_10_31_9]PIZ82459.1 MAG: hypothetical protein COX97_04710 [Candidatus Pacearchaeota archaeon CG_4_10_14_0_2_um_filter_05_32_18]
MAKKEHSFSWIKNIIFAIAIIVLTSFVVIYGIQAFYDRPEYNNYCPEIRSAEYVNSSARCEQLNGRWNTFDGPKPVDGPNGYCDLDYYCRQDYEAVNKIYSRNLFIITVPIGIILLLVGGALFSLEAVGAGIMGGGVVTLIYGAGNYWPDATDIFRFIISLVGLVIVIFLAYWLNKELKRKRFWKRK